MISWHSWLQTLAVGWDRPIDMLTKYIYIYMVYHGVIGLFFHESMVWHRKLKWKECAPSSWNISLIILFPLTHLIIGWLSEIVVKSKQTDMHANFDHIKINNIFEISTMSEYTMNIYFPPFCLTMYVFCIVNNQLTL